jgi:hypothetical protein
MPDQPNAATPPPAAPDPATQAKQNKTIVIVVVAVLLLAMCFPCGIFGGSFLMGFLTYKRQAAARHARLAAERDARRAAGKAEDRPRFSAMTIFEGGANKGWITEDGQFFLGGVNSGYMADDGSIFNPLQVGYIDDAGNIQRGGLMAGAIDGSTVRVGTVQAEISADGTIWVGGRNWGNATGYKNTFDDRRAVFAYLMFIIKAF